MTEAEEALSVAFKHFRFTREAEAFLLRVWRMIQAFDDFADGDFVQRKDLDMVIWDAFIGMPEDEFANRYQQVRAGLATMILKWQASDKAERNGKANAMSFSWRAGYYDLIMLVACICLGYEQANAISSEVMNLYGETFDDYMREFNA